MSSPSSPANRLFAPVCLLVTVGLFASITVHAAEVKMRGTVTEVTVYRDQARVVRELNLPASADVHQIRVTGLPEQMDPRSAFTEADPGTSVRTMRVRESTLDADNETKDRMRQLQAKQEDLEKRLRMSKHTAQAIEQDLMTIDKLVDFSADKVKQNLDRATLDVQSVTALADFTMERRRGLAAEYLEIQDEIEQLGRDVEENKQQQGKLSGPDAQATWEALLTVQAPNGGQVRLVYDVGGVNWIPRYSVRSVKKDDGKRTFSLHLDAGLVQDSGESWDDVQLTLSTSTPNRQAARPLLTPLRVHAVEPGQQPATANSRNAFDQATQPDWLDEEMMQRNVQLNAMANQRQVTELTSAAEVQREIAADAGDDVADENFLIDQRMNIASHSQIQTVSVLSEDLDGEMHHVVTPLLSSFAFREAELTNVSGRNLIAGSVDVYLDGGFVGRTTLSPTTAGQKMTIGFGIDRRIRSRRELLAKEEAVQGGNRRSTLKHRLVVSNYHEAPIEIRLIDRIPIAARDGSIQVTLEQNTTDALSKDPLYVRMQRPTGVLRWDLEVPAKSFGSKSFDHEYSYSIELDRQQTIVSNDVQQTVGDLQFQKMNMGGGMGGGGTF